MHLFYVLIGIGVLLFLLLIILIYYVIDEKRDHTKLKRRVERKALIQKEKELDTMQVTSQLSELVSVSTGSPGIGSDGDASKNAPIGYSKTK